MLMSFNAAVVQTDVGEPIPNFNCSIPDSFPNDDAQECTCASGYVGSFCNSFPTLSPTSAPTRMFADFSDCMLEFDGYTCKIKFQTPILTPGLKDCVTWLTSDTLSLAGPNPSCRVLADRMTFQLQLGYDALLGIGAEVQLQDTVSDLSGNVDFTAQGHAQLRKPSPLPVPVVRLDVNPTTLSSCETATVNAVIVNGAHRPVSYGWNFGQVTPTNAPTTSLGGTISPSTSAPTLSLATHQFAVDLSNLAVDQTIFLSLGVENWLNQSNSPPETVVLNRISTIALATVFLFPTTDTIRYNDPLVITSVIFFEGCKPFTRSIQWSVSSAPPGSTLSVDSKSTQLYIAAETMYPLGEYCFNFKVTETADDNQAETYVTDKVSCFTVTRAPVKAVITGGKREATVNQDIVFNGGLSYDPLGSNVGSISYQWSYSGCSVSVSGDLLSSTLTMAGINAGDLCTITLTVTSADMTSTDSTSVNLTITDVSVFDVSLVVNSPFDVSGDILVVSDTNDLSISTVVNGNVQGAVIYTWTDMSGYLNLSDPSVLLTGIGDSALVVDSTALLQGALLMISVTVADDTKTGSAVLSILVDNGPNGGSCDVFPRSGTTLVTEFRFNCFGFTALQQPIFYEYSVNYNNIDNLLQKSTDPFMRVMTLPAGDPNNGNSLVVKLEISDARGTVTNLEFDISVAPLSNGAIQTRLSESISTNLTQAAASQDWLQFCAFCMSEESMLYAASDPTILRSSMFTQLENIHATSTINPFTAVQSVQQTDVVVSNINEITSPVQTGATSLLTTAINQIAGFQEQTVPVGQVSIFPSTERFVVIPCSSAIQEISMAYVNDTKVNSTTAQDKQTLGRSIGILIDTFAAVIGRSLIEGHVVGQQAAEFSNRGLTIRALKTQFDLFDDSSGTDIAIGSGRFNVRRSTLLGNTGQKFDVIAHSNAVNVYTVYELGETRAPNEISANVPATKLFSLDIFLAASTLLQNTKVAIDPSQENIQISLPLAVDPSGPPNSIRAWVPNFFQLTNGDTGWRTTGCTAGVLNIAQTEVTISCNHLTTFLIGAEDGQAVSLVTAGNAEVVTVAALSIAEFPIMLYILIGLYTWYLFGLIFARFHDEELFGLQLRRAVKYSKKNRRRKQGLDKLKVYSRLGRNDDDSDDSEDVMMGAKSLPQMDDVPEVKSNTAVMDLLRKLRDDCAPFEIMKEKGLKPKDMMENEYLQRVGRLSIGQNPDPEGKFDDLRRDAAEGHAFRKRLRMRNDGLEVCEAHDMRDCFQQEAIDRMFNRQLKESYNLGPIGKAPLQLQNFWHSLQKGLMKRAQTPSPSEYDSSDGETVEDDDKTPRDDEGIDRRFSAFSMGSRDGPEQNIEEKDKEFDGDYHYLSAGEDDDEHGKLPEKEEMERPDRRYSAFSADAFDGMVEEEEENRSRAEPRHSYITTNSHETDDEGENEKRRSKGEFEDEYRYSYFSDDSNDDTRFSNSRVITHVERENDEEEAKKRRYSVLSAVDAVPTNIQIVAENKDAVGGEIDSSGDDNDTDNLSFINASERRKRETKGPEFKADDEDTEMRPSSPVDAELLRQRGGTPATEVFAQTDDDKESRDDPIITEDQFVSEESKHSASRALNHDRKSSHDYDADFEALVSLRRDEKNTDDVVDSADPPSIKRRNSKFFISIQAPPIDQQNASAVDNHEAKHQVSQDLRGVDHKDGEISGYNPMASPNRMITAVEAPSFVMVSGKDGQQQSIPNPNKKHQQPSHRIPGRTQIGNISSQEAGHDMQRHSFDANHGGKGVSDSVRNQESANEKPHNFLQLDQKGEEEVQEIRSSGLAPLSSKEPLHRFSLELRMDDIKNLDDGVDVNDEKKARRKSFSRISHRLSTTKEDDASDSSTDFEQETPSACAFYREALTHYHCWLVFSFPSAFQFSVVERWTLGFCIIFGTLAVCSVWIARGPELHWALIGLFAGVLILPFVFAMHRLFIYSQNRVDIALNVHKRYSANVRFATLSFCIFWMIMCGMVTLFFGVELEREFLGNVWKILLAGVIADGVDIALGEPLHLALLVPWFSRWEVTQKFRDED
uniref:PKD/REJ-like domain-containing protein n=2 Tax=Amorphochlora amoebiformis TaxID=1561963 RepID=A0A7S0D2C6_9EUKA|mmetsp:Transcript_16689/g.26479  ORF Transcript_16689/g.26479 Transcript_16689/m.26479 type:complete len:2058 (+) Transcript_16689:92-6265(+)